MFYLNGIDGPHNGRTWQIDSTGLLLGRSVGCNILFDDRAVSRRHCRIVQRGGEVHLEELGGCNPVLVNGEVAKGSLLRPGQHIGLGTSVFVLTEGTGPDPITGSHSPADETYPALSDGQAVYLEREPDTLWLQERPRTVRDLVHLYETTRSLSQAVDRRDLMTRLEVRLRERFGAVELWLARVREEGSLVFTCMPGSTGVDSVPANAIRQVLQQGKGILLPSTQREGDQRVRKVVLAAPMPFGGATKAVLAVRTVPSPDASHTSDLAFLVLLARSLAPLVHALDRIEQLSLENERMSARAGESRSILGESKPIQRVRKTAQAAAQSPLNVLIMGETGTGKELAARMVHAYSPRHDRPLVVVNCAAIPKDLFESELFGHVEGAFTGALRSVPGLLAQADGGTLFLDEVGDLSLENQARILRVVEEGTYRPVGMREEQRVDTRFVAATNRDLTDAIRRGTFREDLYHRLNGFEVHVPPLRERASDIPLLAEHFFRLAAAQAGHPLAGIAPDVVDWLQSRPWPGNVRELRNCIFRAVSRAEGDMVTLEDVCDPAEPGDAVNVTEPLVSLAEVEKRHVESVLRRCNGSVGEAARILGISRSTLYRMLAEHRITP